MDDRRDNGTNIIWYCATSPTTEHIIPVQQHLFNKYVGIDPIYLSNGAKLGQWGKEISSNLPPSALPIVFGLDDFLPIDYLDTPALNRAIHLATMNDDIKRVELGVGCLNHKPLSNYHSHFRYQDETPYSVSTQFSVWNSTELYRCLSKSSDAWNFETSQKTKAACLKTPALRYIEESALSKRARGKVNLCGLRQEDITELIDMKLVNPADIIYGWKGETKRTKDAYGPKYADYF
jgi:hypothetical protein